MSKWKYRRALVMGVLLVGSGWAFAQARTISEQDRAAIRQLSDNYVTFLDGCRASEYASLFTADGSFISAPRGTMTCREKLASLVTSERFCQPGAAPRSGTSHAFSRIVIEATLEGASGKVYLPGHDANTSGGHYEDRYVKTPEGWKFKSRTYFSPKEEQTAAAQ
jgi:hypothetical protein